MLVIERTKGQAPFAWCQINWTAVERNVERLQARIYRATERRDFKRARSLKRLLARSTSAKLLAIRRVTQENSGQHTPGIDGQICQTPEDREALFRSGLNLNGYKPKPVRRVYIPKVGGKKRPLGIPTIEDRVMQAIVKMALEPEWEQRFEANSYGFRPGRSCMDANQAIHTTLNHKGCSEWILDADISGCFDNIDHGNLLERISVFKPAIGRWLKAGVVELGTYRDTPTGTPQGGTISPLLANIALDGIERLFDAEKPDGSPKSPAFRKGRNKGVSLIRYADDFVVAAPSRDVLLQYVKPKLEAFLAERGLWLSEAKTRAAHVDEGFNFLGFTLRRFKGKFLTFPQKEKVKAHLRRLLCYLKQNQQAPVGKVIDDLNPVIRGWTNYYRHAASKRTFQKADHLLWQGLWRWAKRRHPKKRVGWIVERYFSQDGLWRLQDKPKGKFLTRHSDTAVTRYVKVKAKATPMNPDDQEYWNKRRKRGVARETISNARRRLLRRQDGRCAMCGRPFLPGETAHIDDHHVKRRSSGGTNQLSNRRLVHRWCHHAHHQRKDYRSMNKRQEA